MCDPIETRNDIPMGAQVGYAVAEKMKTAYADANLQQEGTCEPTLRDRLEQKRNRLSRELVQVEEALRLVYSDPNVERIHETLKRARV